jgi:hypothetical protein
MILGVSYEEACEELALSPAHGSGRDWENDGTNHLALDHVLQRHGYWRQRLYKAWADADGFAWPPEPFAPVHVCQVGQPSGNAHFVVMLEDGTVLDPLLDGPPHGLGVYQELLNIAGYLKS